MNSNAEVLDPVEEMLKKTGCIELHYKVQVRVLLNIIVFLLIHLLIKGMHC